MRCLLGLLCLLLGLSFTSAQAAQGAAVRLAKGVEYELLGEYDLARLSAILTDELAKFTATDVRLPEPKYPVRLYKVLYDTVIPEKDNRPARVSGLVALPVGGGKTLPVVSYQHGTVFSRREVPSSPDESMETRLVLACFAAQGYAVIGADYIGKGVSLEPDSYLVKESTAQACLDMLAASRLVLSDLKRGFGDLFLSGWSQGAYNSMVFLNRLEREGVAVKAMATACTPNDLYLCMSKWLHVSSELDVNWLLGVAALMIGSYEHYYDLPGLAAKVIRPQYQAVAKDLYENRITWPEAAKRLPAKVRDMVTEEFAADDALASGAFFKKAQANIAYAWRSKTLRRFYYGQADEVVPPYVATVPVEYQRLLGGVESQAVFAGEKANHRRTFIFGLRDQLEWFRSLPGKTN